MKKFNLVKSLTRVINNRKGLLILCLSLATFGVGNVWGQTYNGSTWYSVYDGEEYYRIAAGDMHTWDVFAPVGEFQFEYRRLSSLSTKKDLDVKESSNGGSNWNTVGSQKVDATSYATNNSIKLSEYINKLKIYQNGTGAYIKNVKVKLKNHILLNNGTTYGTQSDSKKFANTKVESISDAVSVNLRSFLTNGNISVKLTEGDSEVFRLGSADNTSATIATSAAGKTYNVGSNACASTNGTNDACIPGKLGNISNYGFKVYFRPKAAQTYNGTITITDGTSKATITLEGTGVLNDNTITWNPIMNKKNWGEELILSATATNTDYSNSPIKFTSDKPEYATVNGDIVTFNQAGAGQQVTITANQSANYKYNAASLSQTFTIKADPILSWQNESAIEINMLKGTTQTITAVSSQNLPVSYESSNNDVLSVGADGKLTAKSVGEATIIASQTGNNDYNATSISKTFYVKTKDTPILTPSWTSSDLKVGDKVTLGAQYVSDGLNGNFKAAYNSTIFNVTREGNTITIEALNEGNASVTFTQTETDAIFGATKTYSFNVSKIDNTLSVADASPTMHIGDKLVDKISTNSDATIKVSSNDETVAHYDLGSQTIIAQNTGNQSFNSKEVTITISQEATYKYTAAEKTIKVTVNKHVPTFTWSNATLYHNQTYNDFFTTNCPNDLTVKSSSDDGVAYLVDGSNAQKLNLKTLTKAASTTLTVTQAENYYWAEHTESKTITPGYASDHVPFTLNKDKYNVMLTGDYAKERSWDNGIRLASTDAKYAFDWDDRYAVIKFSGIPDKLSCSYSCSDASTGRDWRVYQSADGSNWGSAIISTDKAGSANNIQLAPTTRYLKFVYSGNYAGYFQNITVTELKTFSVDKSELDFGSTNKKDMPCANQTFTFNYANVGHKVTLSTSDNHFSVSPASIINIGGDKYGSETITVSYSTAEVHSATNAKLTIKDELGNSKEVTLKGTTTKKAQTLKWEKPYDIEEPAIPIGKIITGAATASSNLGVTYESSNPSVIEILDDGKAFKALTTGSATITAKQAGTEDWEEASISKTFKGTNKIIQVISWNQNFTRLLTNYGTQSLTAIVNLENAETGEQAYSKERSDLITYTSQNTSVVSVNGSTLTIVGKGETTLTATVPGDDLYESATVTIPVKVREPSAGCEDVLLGNDFGSGEYEFFHMNISSDIEKVVKIDRSTPAIPGVLSFQHKGKKWASIFFDGSIDIFESTDNQSSWKKLGSVTPVEGAYNTQTYNLSRNATHVKFFRSSSATGYHYIKNVEIIPAQFIESNAVNNTIDFGVISVNSVETKDFSLKYANVKDNLSVSKSSSDISLSCGDIIDLDCGATGTTPITITFSPKVVGDFSDDIQFLDKNSGKNYTLKITAKVEKSTQHITWEPTQTEYRTIDKIVLNATASSNNPVQYYVKDGTDVADFVNGVLTIKKDGQITIRAYEPGDALWAPAVDVDKTFTIRKTNLHFDPVPKAATITYPQTLSESALTDGVVKDEDGKVVAGTIAWTNPATQLNAGENQSQGITFTPAANPAWYNALSSSVSVTVQKKESDAHAHAGDIIYGAAVGTSVLTNEGTTAGTWTWTDEKKDQVLEVGTHEGLNVHFTPTDKTNYNEIDGTISLTVKKAPATLTWTTAPESADVKDKLTYTATSNHSESAIIYAITDGADCATIDASTGALTITKAGTITVQASQAATTHYEAAEITVTTTLTGEFENVFSGDGDWNDPENWTYGVPTSANPDVVISGSLTISEPISVGGLTIEANGKVTIVGNGDLTINGTSGDRETYGNLFVRNGGDVTISENANVKVFDFVVESSIGTEGQSVSGQVKHSDRVLYTNGAYIDINMDPSGKMDDTQWYAFTVPFPVDVQNGVARKEGDIFRKCTYGVEYMICEYDMTQRLNTGKGWKYIKSGKLQPGRFYYITVNGDYNVYSFKAAENTITINNTTELRVNGEGPNANWNAVGNTTLTYATISGEKVPDYVQTYVNGESRYITIATDDAQFVVGCPFFFQASETATMILNEANGTVDTHYAPRQESLDKPVCVRIAEEGKHFSDQIYLTASQEATSEYTLGRDLAKAGIGTKSAQLWMNAYGQKLSVQDATLMGEQAYYELSIYAPKAGSYELSLPKVPSNAVIYLTQNGYPIWNLNETPYVIECYKGTTNEYGLLLRLQEGGSPTDMQTMRGSEKVQKIMKDQRIYINANTQLYDLMGQKVK